LAPASRKEDNPPLIDGDESSARRATGVAPNEAREGAVGRTGLTVRSSIAALCVVTDLLAGCATVLPAALTP